MSAFTIFALVLTFIYVVYYAVLITMDLHGKKDEKKTDEENIDVSNLTPEEQPVNISESSGDADGGVMTYTEQTSDDGLRVVNPSGNIFPPDDEPSPESADQPQNTDDGKPTSLELNEEIEDDCEMVEQDYQVTLSSDAMAASMQDRHNKRKIDKKNAIDHL